mmetsp:Transcript_169873/g.545149  ORF Transcript_169873/g.545149 Transcript_169873/m.545149 type:complete len:256 (-) Transcript_169873:24-791(-)
MPIWNVMGGAWSIRPSFFGLRPTALRALLSPREAEVAALPVRALPVVRLYLLGPLAVQGARRRRSVSQLQNGLSEQLLHSLEGCIIVKRRVQLDLEIEETIDFVEVHERRAAMLLLLVPQLASEDFDDPAHVTAAVPEDPAPVFDGHAEVGHGADEGLALGGRAALGLVVRPPPPPVLRLRRQLALAAGLQVRPTRGARARAACPILGCIVILFVVLPAAVSTPGAERRGVVAAPHRVDSHGQMPWCPGHEEGMR